MSIRFGRPHPLTPSPSTRKFPLGEGEVLARTLVLQRTPLLVGVLGGRRGDGGEESGGIPTSSS